MTRALFPVQPSAFAILLLLVLTGCRAAPTPAPNRVQGEYIAGGAYRVSYEADAGGFRASVRLIARPVEERPPVFVDEFFIVNRIQPDKPQDDEGIGCSLRNSLCGKWLDARESTEGVE